MRQSREGVTNVKNEDSSVSIVEFFDLVRQDFRCYQIKLGHKGLWKSVVMLFLFHPGFQLILSIRLQRQLGSIPVLGSVFRRVLWYLTSVWTGTEIAFRATFGTGVYFPHPTGIVIGEAWDIAEGVTIMQGVTLGQKGASKPIRRAKVAANAMVCAGAVAVGEILIGKNSVIGANAVVICDVPDNSTAVGVPARIIQKFE